jgi:hypothetical protein
MLETELREAMGAFTATVIAPADLLQGVRVKRRRRIVRNRFLAGGAVAAVALAAIPFVMSQDNAAKPVRPAATPSVTPTTRPGPAKIRATAEITPQEPARLVMTENDISLEDDEVENQDGDVAKHAPIEPGRYVLMVQCEGAGKVRITMATRGSRKTHTIPCPSGLAMDLRVPKNAELTYAATHIGKGRAAIGWKLYRDR